MRFWYDLEFLEDGETIEPISIGVVGEDGREFYAVFDEVWTDQHLHRRICEHDWLIENVVPHLPLAKGRIRSVGDFRLDPDDPQVLPTRIVRRQLLEFLTPANTDGRVELWGWYPAYDHVALMQLWGPARTRPDALPLTTFDMRQLVQHLGGVRLPRQDPEVDGPEHHALADARWNRRAWLWLQEQVQAGELTWRL